MKRNTTQNADTISNAYEAGYRARQGAQRADAEHTRRRINPGPSRTIPIWRGLFNLLCGLILLGWLLARQKAVPHNPPSVDVNTMKMDRAVNDAHNGVYKGNGIAPMSEEVRRAMTGVGIR